MKATITFESYDVAKSFARDYAFYSRKGYTLGAKNKDGGAELILDSVSDEERNWIDLKIAGML